MQKKKDFFEIDGRKYKSRLIMGTSLYPNQKVMKKCLEISETELVTVSIRRVDLNSSVNIFNDLKKKLSFIPNTAGCYTKKEVILTAELGRELLQTNLIKLELIAEDETLLPNSVDLIDVAKELIKKKFKVLAYCSDDPIFCKKLEEIGCEAVMPLVSPIGSGLGIRNEHNLELIRDFCKGKVIVDAGIGKPSDAVRVMELGFDAVLLNSAVARSMDPIEMAYAMNLAIKSGRAAYIAGIIEKNKHARRSSPMQGKITNF
ncbi:thiazole synthase [Rickettsiales bacterium]|nr:thiazole synthase [Rickettsiales bacterium]